MNERYAENEIPPRAKAISEETDAAQNAKKSDGSSEEYTFEDVLVKRALLPQIAALETRCFSNPWSLRSFEAVAKLAPLYDFPALCKDGRVIGYAVFFTLFDEAELQNIAVAPEERGRGAGRRLLLHCLETAQKRGVRTVRLEVRESNGAARALYESFGFKGVGMRRDYYRNPTENALLLSLDLG